MPVRQFFCMSAERDTDEITREIMPNLMKNKGFDITRHGIVEKEDDPMQDILDPDAAEHSMEELERSLAESRRHINSYSGRGSGLYINIVMCTLDGSKNGLCVHCGTRSAHRGSFSGRLVRTLRF